MSTADIWHSQAQAAVCYHTMALGTSNRQIWSTIKAGVCHSSDGLSNNDTPRTPRMSSHTTLYLQHWYSAGDPNADGALQRRDSPIQSTFESAPSLFLQTQINTFLSDGVVTVPLVDLPPDERTCNICQDAYPDGHDTVATGAVGMENGRQDHPVRIKDQCSELIAFDSMSSVADPMHASVQCAVACYSVACRAKKEKMLRIEIPSLRRGVFSKLYFVNGMAFELRRAPTPALHPQFDWSVKRS